MQKATGTNKVQTQAKKAESQEGAKKRAHSHVLRSIMLVGMLHDKCKSKLNKKGAGRCTYMVKPPDVFTNYRIRKLWKGSQAGAPKWWSRHLRRGSPTPIDWNFSNKLISSTRWDSFSATGPSFLEVPDSHSFTHMVICSWICLTDPPALGSASGSGWSSPWSSSSYSSSYSWSSCSSSPQLLETCFLFLFLLSFFHLFPYLCLFHQAW